MVTSLGEAREVTRLPGRLPAWSSGRTSVLLHPPAGLGREAAFDVALQRCKTQGAIATGAWRMKRDSLTAVGSSRVFVPAADPLFCSAKKVGQKRRPLRRRSVLRTDCTRRQGLKREASETRFAQTADASLSVSVPGDASPSNGDPLQRQRQKQQRLQLQLQLQRAELTRAKLAGGHVHDRWSSAAVSPLQVPPVRTGITVQHSRMAPRKCRRRSIRMEW